MYNPKVLFHHLEWLEKTIRKQSSEYYYQKLTVIFKKIDKNPFKCLAKIQNDDLYYFNEAIYT